MIRMILEGYPRNLSSKTYKYIEKVVSEYIAYKFNSLSTVKKEETKDYTIDKVFDRLLELQDDETSELYNVNLDDLDQKKLKIYIYQITKFAAGHYYKQHIYSPDKKNFDALDKQLNIDSPEENISSGFSMTDYINKDENRTEVYNFMKKLDVSDGDYLLFTLMSELDNMEAVSRVLSADEDLKNQIFPKADATKQAIKYRYDRILKKLNDPESVKLFQTEFR